MEGLVESAGLLLNLVIALLVIIIIIFIPRFIASLNTIYSISGDSNDTRDIEESTFTVSKLPYDDDTEFLIKSPLSDTNNIQCMKHHFCKPDNRGCDGRIYLKGCSTNVDQIFRIEYTDDTHNTFKIATSNKTIGADDGSTGVNMNYLGHDSDPKYDLYVIEGADASHHNQEFEALKVDNSDMHGYMFRNVENQKCIDPGVNYDDVSFWTECIPSKTLILPIGTMDNDVFVPLST